VSLDPAEEFLNLREQIPQLALGSNQGRFPATTGRDLLDRVRLGFDPSPAKQLPESSLSGGATLFPGNVAIAVDHHVNRITPGIVHGGKVRVFGEDDGHSARVASQVFFDRLMRFEDIDGKNDQAFAGKLFGEIVDNASLTFAVFAPRGPEFEQDDLAFHRGVVEPVAGCGLGVEAGSRPGFVDGKRLERECYQ
jgi:hypothetical protein